MSTIKHNEQQFQLKDPEEVLQCIARNLVVLELDISGVEKPPNLEIDVLEVKEETVPETESSSDEDQVDESESYEHGSDKDMDDQDASHEDVMDYEKMDPEEVDHDDIDNIDESAEYADFRIVLTETESEVEVGSLRRTYQA